MAHGNLDALANTLLVITYFQLINYNFYVMVAVAVQLHAVSHLCQHTIGSHLQKTLLHHLFEEFAIVSLPVSYQWSENVYLLAGILLQNHLYELLLGIFHHLLASGIAVRCGSPCKEQSQEVIYLCSGAYC